VVRDPDPELLVRVAMKRAKFILEYDGSGFSGWQIQPGARTVQGVLQDALTLMMGTMTTIVGSGRTDAGVHALGQVAHADVARDIPPRNIMMGLNSSLPRDVRVIDCSLADRDFHAQRSALGKLYRYVILNRAAPTALDRNRVWHIRQALDHKAMTAAARVLIGENDFAAFKSAGDDTTTVRHLRTLQIEREKDRLTLYFEASGFLKHMVRNVTGALVEVGLGKMTIDDLERHLRSRSRENAPPKAAPQGLTLMKVYYGNGTFFVPGELDPTFQVE
jgi:tRNA pseudouridine38-40 synthase